MLLYYEILFGLSVLFSLIYVFMWNKHFDANITLVFFLVPVNILSHLAVARAANLQTAILGSHLPDGTVQYSVCITYDRGTLPLPSSEADTRMSGRTDDAFLSSGALDRSFGYVLQECLFRSGKRCLHADGKALWPVA